MKSETPSKYSPLVAEFLIELRDSGVINMWGAGRYVSEVFDMTSLEADQCLVYWMESFD